MNPTPCSRRRRLGLLLLLSALVGAGSLQAADLPVTSPLLPLTAVVLGGMALGMLVNTLRCRGIQQALRDSERRYRVIVEDQTEFICRNRPDFTLTFINDAYARYFGRTPEELIGRSFLPLIPAADHEAVRRYFAALTPSEPVATHEHPALLANGEVRWHQWTNRAIFDEQGRVTEYQGVGRDITDRKRVEEALRESEQRYHTLFAQGPDTAMVIDGAGRILQVNERAVASLGYSRDELLGMNIADIEVDLIAGEHREKYWSRLGEGERIVVNGRHRRKDGRIFPVEVHLIEVDLGGKKAIYGAARDISERVRAEDAVRRALAEAEEAKESVEIILESLSDGLLFTDRRQAVVLMSPTAEALLGRRWHESFRQPVGELLGATPLPELLAEIVAGGRDKGTVEWTLTGAGVKELRIFQGKASVVRDRSGAVLGVITLLREVTRERELERVKSEFISTAAHELRTPLTAVMGFAELLLNGTELDEATRAECLTIIQQKAETLGSLVDELLDLSRIEAGQTLQLKRQPWDLRELLQRAVRGFVALGHGQRLVFEGLEAPLPVRVDAAKLGQVMDNLFSNAIKFSAPGTPIHISCRTEADGERVRVTVTDRGIGMTPAQLERIFDKFYRADASDTSKGGLGLGMAIVKNIVEAHQGRIWVESELEAGTRVHFTLPLQNESAA